MNKYLTVFLIIGICSAGTFLANGDFEQDLTVGWFEKLNGLNITINRGTGYDQDPDYEAYVYKGTGGGYAKLYQVATVPITDLEFSANAKLYAYDNHASAWCGAAVMISYLNSIGSVLGETMICARSTQCPWTNTTTRHIIPAPDSLWHNYSFNINDELGNLPGIDPTDVNKIEISLFDSIYHC